jgi:Fe2+ transport system protein FeoA
MVSTSPFRLKPGARARVIGGNDSLLAQRLADLGLTPGTEFVIVKTAPLGDPVEIEFRGTRLCVRRHEFAELEYEKIEG